MDILTTASAIAGVSVLLLLCTNILCSTASQNIASFLLFCLMDGATAIVIWTQEGNYALPAAYSVGSLCVCLALLKSQPFHWTWFETGMSLLTAACMIVWWLTDGDIATIACTTAGIIASIPLAVHSWRLPHEQPLPVFVGFCISNGLGIAAGSAWTIQERFYSSACLALTAVVLGIVLYRRNLRQLA